MKDWCEGSNVVMFLVEFGAGLLAASTALLADKTGTVTTGRPDVPPSSTP